MSDASQLVYLMVQGEERGPFALDQVRTMYETGLVTPHTMFKYIEEWRSLVNAMSGAWQPAQPLGRCFLRVRGEQRGPFIFDQVRTMWNEGQITPDAAYKLAEIWQPLARLLGMIAPEPELVSEFSNDIPENDFEPFTAALLDFVDATIVDDEEQIEEPNEAMAGWQVKVWNMAPQAPRISFH